jgi:mRNA interferase MazF
LKQFDIYLVDLNPTIGKEQSGFRPALIISNNYENLLDIVTIIPITSRKEGRKIYPNEVLLDNILEKSSILLTHQIRTISKKRLTKKVISLKDEAIRSQIRDVLSMRFEDI